MPKSQLEGENVSARIKSLSSCLLRYQITSELLEESPRIIFTILSDDSRQRDNTTANEKKDLQSDTELKLRPGFD